MNIIAPLNITMAMITSGTTIPEVDTGETAWVTAHAYVIGDEVNSAGAIYSCVKDHTSGATLPADDSVNWLFKKPSNRMAPFDYYTSTAATATAALTYVMQPGFFNALSAYGAEGQTYALTVKDAPGGNVIKTQTGSLYENAIGLYELLFVPLNKLRKLVVRNIPLSPTAELTFTITAGPGVAVGLGMLNIGNFRPLYGFGKWGGTEQGAEAEPISYSYVKTNDDGTTVIKRRYSATGMRASIAMPRDQADAALMALQDVLDIPVSCIATDAKGYDGLNVFGLISGSMRYESFNTARLSINVKGLI